MSSAIKYEALSQFNVAEIIGQAPQGTEILFDEIYPDVRILETRVRLLEDDNKYPDKDFLAHLFTIVDWVDTALDGDLPSPEPGQPRIYADKFTSSETSNQIDDYIGTLTDIFARHPDRDRMTVATPMFGSLPLLDQFKSQVSEKAHPVFISGTLGVTTGNAEIRKPVAEPLINSDNIVFFADDVSDTCVSVARFAMERHRMRMGDDQIDTRFATLIDELKELKRQRKSFADRKYQPLYQRLVQLLHEEKVVLTPLYNKNQALFASLRDYMGTQPRDTEDPWMELQEICMDQAVPIGEQEWIMGAGAYGPLLDTGVNGKGNRETKGMMDFIDRKYHKELKRLGFDKLYLRLGAGIKKLVVFNPDGQKNAYEELVGWMAGFITSYMEYRQTTDLS